MNVGSLFRQPSDDTIIRSPSSGSRKSSPRLVDIIKTVEPKSNSERQYVYGNSNEDTSSAPGSNITSTLFKAVDPAELKKKHGKKKSSSRRKTSKKRSQPRENGVEEIYSRVEKPQSSQYIIMTPEREAIEKEKQASLVREPSMPKSKPRSKKKPKPKNSYKEDYITIAKPTSYGQQSSPDVSMSPRKPMSVPKSSNLSAKESSTSEEGPKMKLGGHDFTKADLKENSEPLRNKRVMDSIVEQNEDGDLNLDSAIGVAIKAAAEKDSLEAAKNDEQIRAVLLKSMTRPNATKDAIEDLVEERRKSLFVQAPGAKKQSSKRRTKPSSKRPPVSFKPKSDLFSSDEAEHFIETVEEKPSSKPASVKPEPFEVKRRIPKNYDEDSEDDSGEEDSEIEKEKRVRLPNAYRDRKPNEPLGPPDELGNRERIYDPLGADRDLFDRYEFEGNGKNPYEESSEDEEMMTIDEKKDEMIYRFKLIQEAYPRIALPRITKRMKLARMVRHYDCVLDRLKLKRKTTNFRLFLVIGLLGVQFGIKWLTGLDTSGFTENQMQCIAMYEKYLREFGESDWSLIGENTPLWVRLPFAVAVNFAIFMAAKFAYKASGGKNLTSEFHRIYAEMTGDDSYHYLREKDTSVGLDSGEGLENGGMFGMLQKLVGMLGGGGEGGGGLGGILGNLFGGGGNIPKRGEAEGPNYVRRKKKDD